MILHTGWESGSDLVFVGVVGIIFSVIVERTGSILGVSFSCNHKPLFVRVDTRTTRIGETVWLMKANSTVLWDSFVWQFSHCVGFQLILMNHAVKNSCFDNNDWNHNISPEGKNPIFSSIVVHIRICLRFHYISFVDFPRYLTAMLKLTFLWPRE